MFFLRNHFSLLFNKKPLILLSRKLRCSTFIFTQLSFNIMKKILFIVGYSAGLYLTFQACKKTETVDSGGGAANSTYINAADCTGSTPTYTSNIKPIFDSKCATSGCHVGAAAAHGLDLSSYATSKSQFNVHAFLCAINQDAGCSKMPKTGSKLPAAEIKSITCWAKNGFTQ